MLLENLPGRERKRSSTHPWRGAKSPHDGHAASFGALVEAGAAVLHSKADPRAEPGCIHAGEHEFGD